MTGLLKPTLFAGREFDLSNLTANFDRNTAGTRQYVRQFKLTADTANREPTGGEASGIADEARPAAGTSHLPEQAFVRAQEDIAHPRNTGIPDVIGRFSRRKHLIADHPSGRIGPAEHTKQGSALAEVDAPR